MHRIDTPNRAVDLFGAGKDGWRDGNKALGINPTEFNADMMNALQEELAGIAEAAGLTLNPSNRTQVLEAITKMIEARVGDYSLDTGTANAKVVALNPAITSYTGNFGGTFKNAVLNAGACTINFGGGAVPLVRDDGVALAAGDLPAGVVVGYQYIHADVKAYITSLVTTQIGAGKTVGEIFWHLGDSAPANALVVPVAATNISRATYADLHTFCAALGYPWGNGDGSTTFGMPYLAADFALVQANANMRTTTVGAILAHTHTLPSNEAAVLVGGGSSAGGVTGSGVTGSTGGTNNLAAGMRALLCVQYK